MTYPRLPTFLLSVLAVLFVSGSALAQEAAAPAPSGLALLFWSTLLPIIATVVGTALVAGLTYLGVYLRGLAKTNKAAGYAADFIDIVTHTVQHAEAEIKPGLLGDLAATGGKLTPENAAKLKGQVKDLILKDAAPEVIAAVKAKVGEGAFQNYLSGAIETAVAKI